MTWPPVSPATLAWRGLPTCGVLAAIDGPPRHGVTSLVQAVGELLRAATYPVCIIPALEDRATPPPPAGPRPAWDPVAVSVLRRRAEIRAEQVRSRILPQLAVSQVVLCDRYIGSDLVTGYLNGVDPRQAWHLFDQNPWTDVTAMITAPIGGRCSTGPGAITAAGPEHHRPSQPHRAAAEVGRWLQDQGWPLLSLAPSTLDEAAYTIGAAIAEQFRRTQPGGPWLPLRSLACPTPTTAPGDPATPGTAVGRAHVRGHSPCPSSGFGSARHRRARKKR